MADGLARQFWRLKENEIESMWIFCILVKKQMFEMTFLLNQFVIIASDFVFLNIYSLP